MATRSPAKKTSVRKSTSKPIRKVAVSKTMARKTAARKTVTKSTRKSAQATKAKTKRPPRLAGLNDKHFSARLHQHFIIRPESGEPITAELISVTKLGPRPLARKGAARPFGFSIVLRTSQSNTYLPQHIYSVEHSRLGKHQIFLVPVGPDEHGMRYEAIFD